MQHPWHQISFRQPFVPIEASAKRQSSQCFRNHRSRASSGVTYSKAHPFSLWRDWAHFCSIKLWGFFVQVSTKATPSLNINFVYDCGIFLYVSCLVLQSGLRCSEVTAQIGGKGLAIDSCCSFTLVPMLKEESLNRG